MSEVDQEEDLMNLGGSGDLRDGILERNGYPQRMCHYMSCAFFDRNVCFGHFGVVWSTGEDLLQHFNVANEENAENATEEPADTSDCRRNASPS